MIARLDSLPGWFGHPGSVSLQRFASGDISSERRAPVAAHLARCQRCRDLVSTARELSQRVRDLPIPAAAPGVIGVVLAARARGERMILPAEPLQAKPHRRRSALAAAVAALIAVAVLPGTLDIAVRRLRSNAGPLTEPTSDPVAGDVVSLLNLRPAAANAQGLTEPGESEVRIHSLDAARVREGAFEYELRTLENGRAAGTPERGVVRVSSVAHRGTSAWQVEHAWLGHPQDNVETTVFDARTLAPLYRRALDVSRSRFTVEQQFVGDSLFGAMESTAPPRPVKHYRRGLPRGARPFGAGEGFALLYFQSVALGTGWKANISMLGWGAVPADLYYPVRLRVVNTERVSVPAGAFDCWQLIATSRGHTKRLWIRRTDGVIVRTMEAGDRTAVRHEVVLRAFRPRAAVPAQTGLPRPFRIDASHSDVAFSVGFVHGTRVRGRFDDLRGTLFYDEADPARSSLTFVIGVKSINTGSTFRDEHLRSSDFFDAARFPRIVFQSERVERNGKDWQLTGKLTMRGVTREVVFPVRPTFGPVTAPQGLRTVGFSAAMKIARKDFGVLGGPKFNSWFDELRSAAVSDSVDVTLDVSWWETDFAVDRNAERDSVLARIARNGVKATMIDARRAFAANPKALEGAEWELTQAARALSGKGQHVDAVVVLEHARDLFPQSAASHAHLGLGYERIGDGSAARGAYDRALALDAFEPMAMERRRQLALK